GRWQQTRPGTRVQAARASPRRAGRRGRAAQGGESRAEAAAGHALRRARDADAEERAGARAGRGDDRPAEGDGERRMSGDPSRVTVKILEKEYHVTCPAEERAALVDSAEYLNRKMREIRDSGKVIGLDRIAVMAALNIVNELLQSRGHDEGVETDLAARLKAMRERIESALTRSQPLGN